MTLRLVVEGTAKVTIEKKVSLITVGQSVFVPLGAIHRMENPGKLPITLIEVQIGSYSLHMHNAYSNNSNIKLVGDLKNSAWCFNHALALPLYNDLTFEQQKYIIDQLNSCI